ncbi:MAG TPA: rod shape-determining protein MreC [Vicinamibacterales bacterium]|nr:rod shape-determining protein MreC [Vicinamibacterales bacterium]
MQSRSGLPLLQAVAFGAFAKTQSGTASVADWFRGVWSHYLALRGVAAENDTLRRQVLELQGQLQQEQAVADASRSLEDALKLQQSMPAPTLAARVIAGSPQPGSLTLTVTINRGAADGVQPNMAVIGGLGVIGRVINQPSAHAAQVQLLLDRNAAAAVTLARTGAGGIIKGGASDGLYSVDYVSNQADVQVGERVLTSGQDGIFPAGFIVGYVAKSEKGANYRLVRVSPAVDFSHIDLVLVVLGRPPVAPTTPPSPAAAAAGRGRGGL